jgi:hypothetical protein
MSRELEIDSYERNLTWLVSEVLQITIHRWLTTNLNRSDSTHFSSQAWGETYRLTALGAYFSKIAGMRVLSNAVLNICK